MYGEPLEIGISQAAKTNRRPMRRMAQHTHIGSATTETDVTSPAALDEVFAMIAKNVERMQQLRTEVDDAVRPPSARDVGTIPGVPRAIPTDVVDTSTMQSLGAEMDRQHERLAQLLRDIEGADTSH